MSPKKEKQKIRKFSSNQNDDTGSSEITGNITIGELLGDIQGELQQTLDEKDNQPDQPVDSSG
jgi:hypothetical protein